MRDITVEELTALNSSHYNVYSKLQVANSSGVYIDLSDVFLAGRWGHQVDQPTASGTFSVARENLSPLLKSSPYNSVGGVYSPLLNPGRRIKLYTATVLPGVSPAPYWRSVFDGKIDKVDWRGQKDEINISCRDKGAYLLDTFIRNEIEYIPPEGSVDSGDYYGQPVEGVMEQILAHNGFGPTSPNPVNLYMSGGSPFWYVGPYKQIQEHVLIALRKLAEQIGWVVRYRYINGDNFELDFFNPFRNKTTPDFSIGPSQYIDLPMMDFDDSNVRNYIRVVYSNKQHLKVDTVERWSAESIAEFGERFMEITEGDTSNIDTQGEAEVMAEAARDDLELPKFNHQIETLYWWPVEVGDLSSWPSNSYHYDEGQQFAVVGWEHQISANSHRTRIQTRGRPAGAYESWLRRSPVSPVPSVIITHSWTPSGIGDRGEGLFGSLFYPERHYYFSDLFLQINQYTKSVLIEIDIREVNWLGASLNSLSLLSISGNKIFFEEGTFPYSIFNGQKKYRIVLTDSDGNKYENVITSADDNSLTVHTDWDMENIVIGELDLTFDVWEPLYKYYKNIEVDEWHRVQWPGMEGLFGPEADSDYWDAITQGMEDIHGAGGSVTQPPEEEPVPADYEPPPDSTTAGSHLVLDTEDAPFGFIQNEGPVIFRVTPFSGRDGWMYFGRTHVVNAGVPDISGSGQVDANKTGAGLAGRTRVVRPMFNYDVDPLSRPRLIVDPAHDWGTIGFDQGAIDPLTGERTDPAIFVPDFSKGACHKLKLTEDTVIGYPVDNTVYDAAEILGDVNWNNSNYEGMRLVLVDGETGKHKESRDYVKYEEPDPPLEPDDPDYYDNSYTVNEPWSEDMYDEENGDYFLLMAGGGMWSSETLHLYILTNGYNFSFSKEYIFPGGKHAKTGGLCHCNFIVNDEGRLSGVVLPNMRTSSEEEIELDLVVTNSPGSDDNLYPELEVI